MAKDGQSICKAFDMRALITVGERCMSDLSQRKVNFVSLEISWHVVLLQQDEVLLKLDHFLPHRANVSYISAVFGRHCVDNDTVLVLASRDRVC
jgi:hypothetical protein